MESVHSIAESLLRFVHPADGPVTGITSARHPTALGAIWSSVAHLHERWRLPTDRLDSLAFGGGGWSPDRELSQCKAVTEAVERWAVRYHALHSPQEAGLDADPTSNGFAALPTALPEGDLAAIAHSEALERWALSSLWDDGAFPAAEFTPAPTPATLLLACAPGQPRYFETRLAPRDGPAGPGPLHFVLCLVALPGGGTLPGSACARDLAAAIDRASCEARVHSDALARLRAAGAKPPTHIIERRLRRFADSADGFQKVFSRMDPRAKTPELPAPPPVFDKRLAGPWDPVVSVHRVMIRQKRHLDEGGDDRFLI